jgi:hypothetical protein
MQSWPDEYEALAAALLVVVSPAAIDDVIARVSRRMVRRFEPVERCLT